MGQRCVAGLCVAVRVEYGMMTSFRLPRGLAGSLLLLPGHGAQDGLVRSRQVRSAQDGLVRS